MENVSYNILDSLHFSHPTVEQEAVLKAMEKFVHSENTDDFMVLCGAAGTGKTSITSALIGYLNNLKKLYKIAAPTGRAARILGRKANTVTSTIHSLIYMAEPNHDSGSIAFKLKSIKNDKPVIYIIDEASMIPKEADSNPSLFESEKGLLPDLINYIKRANSSNKIIFLGDQYQLPPIGESESFALNKHFLESTFSLKGSAYLLTEVKRQEEGSYILENATAIRIAIDEHKLKYPISGIKSRNFYAAIDNYVKEINSNGIENAVSIGVSHKANKFFNDLVRERIFKNTQHMLMPGDLLMVTQNWQRNEHTLYNGDHVELLSIDWNQKEEMAGLHFVPVKIKLLFTTKEIIVEDFAILESIISPGGSIENHLENGLRKTRYIKDKIYRESGKPSDDKYVGALRLMYGHAITCNKAQGGEWKKVFINTIGIPSLKWQYTAVTRGINQIESF